MLLSGKAFMIACNDSMHTLVTIYAYQLSCMLNMP